MPDRSMPVCTWQKDKETALHLAAAHGNTALASLLVSKGGDIKLRAGRKGAFPRWQRASSAPVAASSLACPLALACLVPVALALTR